MHCNLWLNFVVLNFSDNQMDTSTCSITQLNKLSTSVSSPTLTDFVRNSFPANPDLTSSDSLSLLFRDLMIPGYHSDAGFTNSDERMSDFGDEESDSGIIFTLGNMDDLEGETSNMKGYNDYDDYSDNGSNDSMEYDYTPGNMFRAPLGLSRNHTSLPDLHVISCF